MTLTEKEAPAADAPREPDAPPEEGNPKRVIQLVAALVLITAAFIALGWGYLLLFIVILFAIVMLHEFGHFITAKRAGMKVTEYFVGFGPRLWSVRKGETEYGVKAIPAGGYVRITGFTSTEEVPEEDEARAYRQQPFHQRIIVASAGSAMHFLIAFVLALILVLTFGQATNNVKVYALDHWAGKTTPAAAGGAQGRGRHRLHQRQGVHRPQYGSSTAVIARSTGKPLDTRGRARRQADPPDRHPRERQGDQGRRQAPGQARLPRLHHRGRPEVRLGGPTAPGRRSRRCGR